jgi:PhoPQ-activated pathogenicity-related protein
MRRGEAQLIAETWREYFDDTVHRPDWLALLPMTKSAFQAMRAAQEFLAEKEIAQIEGWAVSGASKRGWTSELVAATKCETCPAKVIAMMPVVPIVPDLIKDIHRQWRSYNGFTFAFQPYLDVGIMPELDSSEMAAAFKIMDSINYLDRLEKIPKYHIVSSDDEFMSMDWTNIYWDKLKGEKHLSILPNTEHSMSTGLPEAIGLMSTWTRSIASGFTSRPTFDFQYNDESGEITVTIPKD